MAQENGQHGNSAIDVVRFMKERCTPSLDAGYRLILVALAKVYRNDDRNIIDHALKCMIMCEKDVHQVSEDDFLEAIRIVYQPQYPIVYPDQFRPYLIIDVDGTVLWIQPETAPKPAAPPEPLLPGAAPEDA